MPTKGVLGKRSATIINPLEHKPGSPVSQLRDTIGVGYSFNGIVDATGHAVRIYLSKTDLINLGHEEIPKTVDVSIEYAVSKRRKNLY